MLTSGLGGYHHHDRKSARASLIARMKFTATISLRCKARAALNARISEVSLLRPHCMPAYYDSPRQPGSRLQY